MYECHFSGRSSNAKIAETGQTGTQAPQSMHSTGSMKSWSTASNPGRPSSYCVSFFGWMQSTGQASTHAVSFVPMQGSAMIYAIVPSQRLPHFQLYHTGPKTNCRCPFHTFAGAVFDCGRRPETSLKYFSALKTTDWGLWFPYNARVSSNPRIVSRPRP